MLRDDQAAPAAPPTSVMHSRRFIRLLPMATHPPQQQELQETRCGSFNHLVGTREHGWRDIEAERLGGFQIHYEFVRRLLDRQVSRFRPFQDLIHETSRSTPTIAQSNAIAQQTTGLDKLAVGIEHRKPCGCRQGNYLSALTHEQSVRRYDR